MNPKGKMRNLPEIIIDRKNFKRENVEVNNNYYSPWLIHFIKKYTKNNIIETANSRNSFFIKKKT